MDGNEMKKKIFSIIWSTKPIMSGIRFHAINQLKAERCGKEWFSLLTLHANKIHDILLSHFTETERKLQYSVNVEFVC